MSSIFTKKLLTAGLPQKSIRNEVWSLNPRDHQQYSMTHFRYLDAACYFNATFNFPEYDMQGIADYQNYYNSILFILDKNWNFDLVRNKYPAKEIFAIDDKLNDVLERLPQPVKPSAPVMKKELSEKNSIRSVALTGSCGIILKKTSQSKRFRLKT